MTTFLLIEKNKMNYYKESLELHKKNKGKIAIKIKVPLKNKLDLCTAYTPGVAEPCKKIAKNPKLAYDYTIKSNSVAVITNGTAVLGLGKIGALAALPVMEGKCILFKKFANIDAYPLCINTQDKEEFINAVKLCAPGFGGINLEDIKAPECFEIEERLKKELNIPVFHDDQHGTAIVTLAALINALKIVDKKIHKIKIIINGAGAAGIATAKLLLKYGAKNLTLIDRQGALYPGRENMNPAKKQMAEQTNPEKKKGRIEHLINGVDVFIGNSVANVLKPAWVKMMAPDSIVFALANPVPEIDPQKAKQAGAKIIATGRSDYYNQINNVLAFPGIFRGLLDARASQINYQMKIKAAETLASLVKNPTPNKIIPYIHNKQIVEKIAQSISQKGR